MLPAMMIRMLASDTGLPSAQLGPRTCGASEVRATHSDGLPDAMRKQSQ